MLLQIRNMNKESLDMDETIQALAFCKLTKAEYDAIDLPAPDWLTTMMTELQREVKRRRHALLERALQQAEARAESLKSREQRVTDVSAEITRLKAELNK